MNTTSKIPPDAWPDNCVAHVVRDTKYVGDEAFWVVVETEPMRIAEISSAPTFRLQSGSVTIRPETRIEKIQFFPDKKLRDKLAMAAIQGLLASAEDCGWTWDSMANMAYKQANAMMLARENTDVKPVEPQDGCEIISCLISCSIGDELEKAGTHDRGWIVRRLVGNSLHISRGLAEKSLVLPAPGWSIAKRKEGVK